MVKTYAALASIVLMSACFHHQEPALCETYNGMLPAASSVGIDTTLNFLPNGRYQETDIYVGEKDGTFVDKGTYKIQNNRITLISDKGETSFYRLEKKQIRRLNTNGSAITGNLADFYILKCK